MEAVGARRVASAARGRGPAALRRPRRAVAVEARRGKSAEELAERKARLRSEAQAPFRVVRQFAYGALGASAGLGTAVSFLQLATKLAGAPNPPPVSESGTNLAVNAVVLALMVTLWRREEASKTRQLARINREETLAALTLELGTGRLAKLGELRSFSRPVIFAGDAEHVAATLAAAEPFKDELKRRGVVVVPVVLDDLTGQLEPDADDPRWLAAPVYPNQWFEWLKEQMSMAKSVAPGSPVYIGLRKDGRVRSSGVGAPPWERFAAELPPSDGAWGGVLDGMDGRVAVDT